MYDNDCALEYRLNGDGESYSVTDLKPCGETLNIPATHNGLPVTAVREFAFRFCDGLIRAVICGNVDEIGVCSFYDCPLESLIIGKTVTRIGENSFKKCSSLAEIIVADGNERYHSASNCLIETATKTLILGCKNSVIPSDGSVTAIANGAFQDCKGLENLTIPDCVTKLGNQAFQDCNSLSSITIGKNLTEIGNATFQNCPSIEKIKAARNNPKYRSAGNCLIDANTQTLILGCRKSVVPYDGVKIIGRGAFQGCSSLKSLTLPNGVTTISPYSFYGCNSIKTIELGDGVSEIGENAFYGCNNLRAVTVSKNNEKYRAADNCIIETESGVLVLGCKDGTMPADGSVLKIGTGAFRGYAFDCVTVPDGVTEIGDYAFYACTQLARISLPAGIKKIGGNVLLNCVSLKRIDFGGNTAQWLEVEKDGDWNLGTGKYTVNCTDGILDKNNYIIPKSA